MRAQPGLSSGKIKDGLFNDFGLSVAEIEFLPRGGDFNTAVYHVVTWDGTPYFLKFRRGVVDEISLLIPKFLSDSGIREIIAPITTKGYQLWNRMDNFHMILSPFTGGRNAFEVILTESQWVAFGAKSHPYERPS